MSRQTLYGGEMADMRDIARRFMEVKAADMADKADIETGRSVGLGS